MARTKFVLKTKPKLTRAGQKMLLAEARKDISAVGDDYLMRVNGVVENWSPKSKPYFFKRVASNLKRIHLTIYVREKNANKPIWKWVDKTGTAPHKIRAKTSKGMRFAWGGRGSYNPKTRAGNPPKHSGSGTVSNGRIVKFDEVNHPGFEPREFTGRIEPIVKKNFLYAVRKGFRRGFKKL